jgi:hypothetical protein
VTDQERIGTDLAELGAEVRSLVTQPPAGAVRRRAEHQQRVRRTATAALAAAAVLALTIGGISVVRGSAAPPPPDPATTGTPSPWPKPKITDPIGATDWRNVTITFPRHEGCPSGPVEFKPAVTSPPVLLNPELVAFGDLTGDGRPEAILPADCRQGAEDSGDGQGQLVAVTRDGDKLRALGWVGPRGGLYTGHWVKDGRLYVDVHPWHEPWAYALGSAQVYRWSDGEFVQLETPAEYQGLGAGVPVDLGPVAGRTGCPTPVLRFSDGGRAQDGGTTFDLDQPTAPDFLPHLVDLEGDGVRRLLVAITCDRRADDGLGTTAVVLLERQADGRFVALDAIRPPAGASLNGWHFEEDALIVEVADRDETTRLTYFWTGAAFQR